MGIRVELDKGLLITALEQAIGSLKRAMNTAKNPAFKPILEKDIASYQNAINTLSEVK